MAANDKAFVGSIPEFYDTYLGPFLFEPYADDLAARLAGFDGEVLEVAAGTGVATRALDRALGAGATITATDLNEPMLEHAAGRLRSARVAWRPADGQALPFADGSFDVVVCQFGVMFFPDRAAGYREARRVLRDGGRYLFSVWDSLAENEAARVASEAVAARFPNDPPQFIERTPYGYFDRDRIRRELADAGFDQIDIEPVRLRGRSSARDMARGYCEGSPLCGEIEARDATGLARTTDAVAQALADRFGTGPVETSMQALLVTARA